MGTAALERSLADYKIVRDRATALLGEPLGARFIRVGKVYGARQFSGQYISALVRTEDGCAFVLRLLERLAAGSRIPVILMDTYRTGIGPESFPLLQIEGGKLYRVFRYERWDLA